MEFDLLYMDEPGIDQAAFEQDLHRDLKLKLLLEAMSGSDKTVYEACSFILVRPLVHVQSIRLRNAVIRDAVLHRDVFIKLRGIARDTLARFSKLAEFVKPKYDKVVSNANKIVNEAEITRVFLEGLTLLQALLSLNKGKFQAEGMLQLCDAVRDAFADGYLLRIQTWVNELAAVEKGSFVQISGQVGEGLKYTDAVLNQLSAPSKRSRLSLSGRGTLIPLNSITLQQNAQEISEKALLPIFKTIAAFNKAARGFFEKLDDQMKFLLGCIRLHEGLVSLGVPVCYPEFSQAGEHEAKGLLDAGLVLKEGHKPIGNDIRLAGNRLIIITGPNQGGKTTFLRSIGLAQLMAQCGMFVTARQYISPVYRGIFTHFPNGEDASMQMGLLEVELSRLSRLTGVLAPGALLMMNESFQTTTPGDAKRLASQIVPALLEAGVQVFFVTHLYDYAKELYDGKPDRVLFLKAQRTPEGKNTYCVLEGEPFKSAFGLALFEEVMNGKP